MQLKSVLEPSDDIDKQLKSAYNKILDLCKPKILDPRIKGNAVTAIDKNYQKTLVSLKENNVHAENFTIFEMMNTLEFFEEKSARMKAEMDKIKSKQKGDA